MLCGYSTSQQCNMFIGCKPHSRNLATVWRPMTLCYKSSTAAEVQLVVRPCLINMRLWVRVPPRTGFFSHVCADFDILGRCGIILFWSRLRVQLQYGTALHFIQFVRWNFELPFHFEYSLIVWFACFPFHTNVRSLSNNPEAKLFDHIIIVQGFVCLTR